MQNDGRTVVFLLFVFDVAFVLAGLGGRGFLVRFPVVRNGRRGRCDDLPALCGRMLFGMPHSPVNAKTDKPHGLSVLCTLSGVRTLDPLIKSQLLYQLS